MEVDHTSGEEPDGEPAGDPEDSVPRLPAVGSAAGQAMMAAGHGCLMTR
ncbi:hypothetical protein GGC64_002994 [Mycobacterium sp. OAS707]|nr:hypothetical protein [Mycobacterium sp. OAS707]MBE1548970.1 hypothetical protein [Mycobacterium sp. OAS707]